MNQRVKDLFRSMATQADIKRVCLGCVQDDVIRTLFSNQPIEICFVCGRDDKPTVDVQMLARLMQRNAESFYEVDPELHSRYRGMELEELIAQMLQCEDPALVQEIKSLIVVDDEGDDPENPPFFWNGNTYQKIVAPFESTEDERDYIIRQWEHLTSALTHRHRFFNKEAEEYFAQIFREALQVIENTIIGERAAAVHELPQGSVLYRARLVNTLRDQEAINAAPASQMGAPPSQIATNNRMNPAGISLFYGAEDPKTCIAEVRPSIGDKVALAKFETSKPLKLFDFHGLDRYLRFPRVSPFEDAPHQRRERQAFLRYLHQEISKPARKDGISYIVTQAMTEFFVREYGGEFAGFCFQSVQNQGGRNVVLFGHSKTAPGYAPNWEPAYPVTLKGPVAYFDVTLVDYGYEPSKGSGTYALANGLDQGIS